MSKMTPQLKLYRRLGRAHHENRGVRLTPDDLDLLLDDDAILTAVLGACGVWSKTELRNNGASAKPAEGWT